LIKPRISTDPVRGIDANAVRITYGLATGRVGACINVYRSTEESPREDDGLVNGNPVEVREGSGVFVKVQVAVAESPFWMASCCVL
jgi:hypothetical protein